jgi:WASH complex subunit strumpellin
MLFESRTLIFQVINVYMGLTANLAEAWEPYKAAISALVNTLETSNLKDYSSKRHAKLQVRQRK